METHEDICSIVPCNAAAVLTNLKQRFLDNCIYVSDIFKTIFFKYSLEFAKLYHKR